MRINLLRNLFIGSLIIVLGQMCPGQKFTQNNQKIAAADFYSRKANLYQLVRTGDSALFRKELQKASTEFQENEDYFNFFKVYGVFPDILNGKTDEAKKKLAALRKTLLHKKNLPLTIIAIHSIEGFMKISEGKHSEAVKNYETILNTIEKNRKEKIHFLEDYVFYGNTLIALGQYEKALEILFEIISTGKNNYTGTVYNNIGICYLHLNQMDKAKEYYSLAVENAAHKDKANFTSNLAILHIRNLEIDKAEKTVRSLDFTQLNDADSAAVFSVLADIEKHKQNKNNSLEYFQIVMDIDSRMKNYQQLANDYLAVGILHKETGDFVAAEDYFNRAYTLLKEIDDKYALGILLEEMLLSDFLRSGNVRNSERFEEYINIMDEINSESVQNNSNELNIKYQTAEKETRIAQQNLALEKEKSRRNMALTGIGSILLISAGGYLWNRNRQKRKALLSENTLLGLQQNLNEMELQSLNQQLDPHEIKNLLASISPEIQEKAPESYRKMLKLFNITKASLNSSSLTDTIENQTQQVRDLLSLKRGIMHEPLQYFIENTIQNQQMEIPRLMLKNLVENAVKHGIKGKPDGGEIRVKLKEKMGFLHILVDDTGKGRKLADSPDNGIGIYTYQKLFSTLNQRNKESATFEITDKKQGTRVEVNIPLNYQYK
ncbi:MAG: ATP-binding protein [Flavobacteriaceae bacterium]|nr:ATP-binding protein [Flavobacteriaceae bacterium]